MPLNLPLGPHSTPTEGLSNQHSKQNSFVSHNESIADFSSLESDSSFGDADIDALVAELSQWIDQYGGGKDLPDDSGLSTDTVAQESSLTQFFQTLSPNAVSELSDIVALNSFSSLTSEVAQSALSQANIGNDSPRATAISALLQGLVQVKGALVTDPSVDLQQALAKEFPTLGISGHLLRGNPVAKEGASLGHASADFASLFSAHHMRQSQDASGQNGQLKQPVVPGLSLLGAESFDTFHKVVNPGSEVLSATPHGSLVANEQSLMKATANSSLVKAEALFNGQVELPVESRQWGAQLASRLSWMVNQGLVAADLHLTPAELGPMQVRIDSHQDRSTVTFVSPHAATREAIEASLPRLRELFSSQGLDLLEVDIQDDSSFRSQTGEDSGEQEKEGGHDTESRRQPESVVSENPGDDRSFTTVNLRYGIVDAFA